MTTPDLMLPALFLVAFLPLAAWYAWGFRVGFLSPARACALFATSLVAVAVSSALQACIEPDLSRLGDGSLRAYRAFVEASLTEELVKLASLGALLRLLKGPLSRR